jgi:Flp pilus assembly protein TadB
MPARMMRFLRTLHLYLGCLFAPILIFFAATGSWQLFNWHESKKDRTYIAPPALAALSFVHKDAHIPGTPGRQSTPLRYFMLAAAVGLVATAVIGVVMAYRFSQRPLVATVCLLSGIALPAVFLWIYK